MKKMFIEIWFADKSLQAKYGRDLLFISRLFSRYISDISIDDLRKISIEIVDSPDKAHVISTHKFTKVCVLYKHLNLPVLSEIKNEIAIYELFLDFVMEGLIELSEQFKWPIEKFKDAYDKVIESKFKNEFVLISKKYSNDKRYGASIIVNSTKEFISINIELNDKKQLDEIRRIELAKIVFYKDDFSNIVHKLKWIGNEELIVTNKDEEISFRYSVREGVPELFLTPKIHDEKYLQDELKLLNPETSKEEFLAINNRRIAILSSLYEDSI